MAAQQQFLGAAVRVNGHLRNLRQEGNFWRSREYHVSSDGCNLSLEPPRPEKIHHTAIGHITLCRFLQTDHDYTARKYYECGI